MSELQKPIAHTALFALYERKAPNGQVEIDIGNYEIFIGTLKVGEVWVEQDPDHSTDPTYLIEHWCLFTSYQQPSSTNTNVTLRFEYATGLHGSTADFLRWARTQSGARYIKSMCHEQ